MNEHLRRNLNLVERICRKHWKSELPVVVGVTGGGGATASDVVAHAFWPADVRESLLVIRFAQGTMEDYPSAAKSAALRILRAVHGQLESQPKLQGDLLRACRVIEQLGWDPSTAALCDALLAELKRHLKAPTVVKLPYAIPPRDPADRATFDVALGFLTAIDKGCLLAPLGPDPDGRLDVGVLSVHADLERESLLRALHYFLSRVDAEESIDQSVLDWADALSDLMAERAVVPDQVVQAAARLARACDASTEQALSPLDTRIVRLRCLLAATLMESVGSFTDRFPREPDLAAQVLSDTSLGLTPPITIQLNDQERELTRALASKVSRFGSSLVPAFSHVGEARTFVHLADVPTDSGVGDLLQLSTQHAEQVCLRMSGGSAPAFAQELPDWMHQINERIDRLDPSTALTIARRFDALSDMLGEFDQTAGVFASAALLAALRASRVTASARSDKATLLQANLLIATRDVARHAASYAGIRRSLKESVDELVPAHGSSTQMRLIRANGEARLRLAWVATAFEAKTIDEQQVLSDTLAVRQLYEDIAWNETDRTAQSLSFVAGSIAVLWATQDLLVRTAPRTATRWREGVSASDVLSRLRLARSLAGWLTARQWVSLSRRVAPSKYPIVAISYRQTQMEGAISPAKLLEEKIRKVADKQSTEIVIEHDSNPNPQSDEWIRRLFCLFASADVVVVLTGPDYFESPWCALEARLAACRRDLDAGRFQLFSRSTHPLRYTTPEGTAREWSLPAFINEITAIPGHARPLEDLLEELPIAVVKHCKQAIAIVEEPDVPTPAQPKQATIGEHA